MQKSDHAISRAIRAAQREDIAKCYVDSPPGLCQVPRARLLGSPMIWQEWRAHNFIFVSRYLGDQITCALFVKELMQGARSSTSVHVPK